MGWEELPWHARILQLDSLTDDEKADATAVVLKLPHDDREPAVPKVKAVALISLRKRLSNAAGPADEDVVAEMRSLKVEQAKAAKDIAELQLQQRKASFTTRELHHIGSELTLQQAQLSLQLVKKADIDSAYKSVMEAFQLDPKGDFCGASYDRSTIEALKQQAREQAGQEATSKRQHRDTAATSNQKQAGPVQRLPGMSLLDACLLLLQSQEQSISSLREDTHMQPVVMRVLHAIAKVVNGCDVQLQDTHETMLHNPDFKPDVMGLASWLVAWSQTVWILELKLSDAKTDTDTAKGQLAQRCWASLEAQRERRHILGIALTMNTIEVLQFSRDEGHKTSGPLPFSISPESHGFKLLVQVLATPKAEQGFVPTPLPDLAVLELAERGYQVSESKLLQSGHSSHVFCVEVVGPLTAQPTKAILKLSRNDNEVDLISKLQVSKAGGPHIVRLLWQGLSSYQDQPGWHSMLLSPYAEPLSNADSLTLVTQVVYDVATAIDAAWGCRILQCDVTPRNFGHFDGRGVLFDFSIGQEVPEVPEGQQLGALPGGFTGTLRWAPLDVLAGQAHTVSSQLEGLFISLYSISAGGNECSRIRHGDVQGTQHWASCRMYQFASVQLGEEERIERRLLPLVSGLHNLFWPLSQGKNVREHRSDVTREEVQKVCLNCLPACAVGPPGA